MPTSKLTQADYEMDIQARVDAERARLRAEAGLERLKGFKLSKERSFTAAERDKVTILFGGLTWKHEEMIKAVFRGSGYLCENIPIPGVEDFQSGKEYGNNGQCNPTYFTTGNLVRYLQSLEVEGLSRQEIVENYVFFTAGSCGPCRFGMYEAEYRYALKNAGFEGFRVLLFQQADGIKAASGEPGLKFTVDFGVGMLNALNVGDVLNALVYQIRPYEVHSGETDRRMQKSVELLAGILRDRRHWHLLEDTPAWMHPFFKKHKNVEKYGCALGKVAQNIFGKEYVDALHACRDNLKDIQVDRFRIRPVVKITGEFWAQTTEGDGNFNMFSFLEKEGAEVLVEPIATWVTYMLHIAKERIVTNADVEATYKFPKWYEFKKRYANRMRILKKTSGLYIGSVLWSYFYHRAIKHLGGTVHRIIPQHEVAKLAHPYYHQLARGGEGYMEVGKNIYYTVNHLCHMVLALKPFGCMPSTQSDGVQSRVTSIYKDMIFLPIETSGEGEVNAHSRVQMALAEAKAKARAEFDSALHKTGKSIEELREYVDQHTELKSALYQVPHYKGIAGTAAQFVLHVSDRINSDKKWKSLQRESKVAS